MRKLDKMPTKQCGFTLAEVLITLVIIGVAIALTIPNLMHKYQIHQLETQFKATNSLIYKATSLAALELGTDDFFGYACNYTPKTKLL